MTIEKAIDTIIHFCDHIIPCDEYGYRIDSDLCDAHQMAVRALIKQNWIPVSERMPDEETTVLLARKYRRKRYVDIGNIKEGRAYCYSDEYKVNFSEHKLTHWMPLPEPPNE